MDLVKTLETIWLNKKVKLFDYKKVIGIKREDDSFDYIYDNINVGSIIITFDDGTTLVLDM